MRALLVNQFFWPDSAPTGVLLQDVVNGLVEAGYHVTVICGSATYVQASSPASINTEIIRIPATSYSRNAIARLLSWVTFLGGAIFRSLTLERFDIVVTLTSPPGLSFLGVLLKMFRRSGFWIWEMDVYPDVAVGAGVLRRQSMAYWLFRRLMDWPRRKADGIITLGECMRELLLSHGFDSRRVFVAENWADGSGIVFKDLPAHPPIDVLYSGNLGLAHDIDTIEGVIDRLGNDTRFRFRFAGGGARRATLEEFCRRRGASTVEFPPYAEQRTFYATLANCHIGLVTLREECVGMVVPSKVYALLASARPILFIGPAGATPARMIEKYSCGWRFDCGDVDGVVNLLTHLSVNPDLIREAGVRARLAFQRFYDRPIGVKRIVTLLQGSDRSARFISSDHGMSE